MKKLFKSEVGITLVALVVTVIILLILAGISISIIGGENGLFNVAKKATEEYKINEAKEEIIMAIMELRIEEESKGDKLDKEDLPRLNDEKIDVGDVSSFPVEVVYESLLFNINENYGVVYISQANRSIITYTTDPLSYTNEDSVSILINVKNAKGIKTIEYPDGDKLNVDGAKERSIDYRVTANGTYTFKVTDVEDKEVIKDVVIYQIDKLAPLDFTISHEKTEKGIKVIGETQDAEENETSIKSGIGYYEYFLVNKDGDINKYNSSEINVIRGTYQVYAIAYDRAGNQIKSNTIEVEIVEIKITQAQISAGTEKSFAINKGKLIGWGNNANYQLGIAVNNVDSGVPIEIKSETKFYQVTTGRYHSLAIDSEGNLWAWGPNSYGQLGDGTTTDRTSPVQIKNGTKFEQVSVGLEHSLAIDSEGNLWAWGRNSSSGRLGDGTLTDSNIPIQIKSGTKFSHIAAGWSHSLAIDIEGNLWAWGGNGNGQLGDGTTTNRASPVQIKNGTKFEQVSVGDDHSLAIDIEGNLWAWGSNDYGQLGDGTTTNSNIPIQITSGTKFNNITAGGNHSLAIDSEGNLWAWGGNGNGQLGDGTTTNRTSPVQIKEGTKFSHIAAGTSHSLAIDSEGNLWAWGNNTYGQLGNGTTNASKSPVQIKSETKFEQVQSISMYSLAIDKNGHLFGWGQTSYSQFENGFVSDYKVFSPQQIAKEIKFKQVSPNDTHILAIDSEGNLWAWGNNTYGQLGNGTTNASKSPVQIKSGTKFKQVAARDNEGFAIDTEGNLWGWGKNYYGVLGDGTTIEQRKPVQIKSGTKFSNITACSSHSLAIDTEGNLWAWGSNDYGQLGDGTTTRQTVPIQIKNGIKFKQVSTGAYHTLAIDTEGNLWAWGWNKYGELGDGTTKQQLTPIQVKTETKFSKVLASIFYYSLAIDTEGNLWAWGNNEYGQLGDGTNINQKLPVQIKSGTKFREIAGGSGRTAAIDIEGNLWACGNTIVGNGMARKENTLVKIGVDLKFSPVSE